MIDPFNTTPWLALRSVPGVGVVVFHRLLGRFGSPEAVFRAAAAELRSVKGVSAAIAQAITTFEDWPRWDAQVERLISLGGEVVTCLDPRFPQALRQIPYTPPFLYVKGTIGPEDDVAIALVGTRKPSHYGRKAGYRLAAELAQRGVTVVSGLARGIDTVVHQGALEAGGRTLAVLGCGLDVIYPPENKEFYSAIPQQGALISEFPLGTPPEAKNFPVRNRIISGLAQGVVVVEAGEQSGAHITAKFALEQNREVFAVPGPVDLPGSVGPHRWIQQGAKLVREAADILEEVRLTAPLAFEANAPRVTVRAPQVEDPILAHLSLTPLQLDELIRLSALPAPEVMSRLTLLELQGLVQELPGKYFVLAG